MLAVCKKITKSNYAYMKRPDPRSAAHTVSVGLVHDGSLLINTLCYAQGSTNARLSSKLSYWEYIGTTDTQHCIL